MEKPIHHQAVIFDLDGVLINSMGNFYEMVINDIRKRGIEISSNVLKTLGKELIEDYQTPGRREYSPIIHLFWKIGRRAGLSKFRALFFALQCVRKAKEVYSSAIPFSDTIDSLTRLKEAGFELGIFTLASKKQLALILEKNDLYHFFNPDALVSRNEVKKLKPDPEGLILAFEGCSSSPDLGFFLGDMPVDIIAGTRAGVKTIGLTTGLVSKEILQEYSSPTIIVDSLEEASDWILDQEINIKRIK